MLCITTKTTVNNLLYHTYIYPGVTSPERWTYSTYLSAKCSEERIVANIAAVFRALVAADESEYY